MLLSLRLRRIWLRNIKHGHGADQDRTAGCDLVRHCFPTISKLSTAFMTESDMWDATVRWVPRRFTLENIQLVIELMDYRACSTRVC